MTHVTQKDSEMQIARLSLEDIRIKLDRLQDQTLQTGQDVTLTKVNTETLLPLIGLLENPVPEEVTLVNKLVSMLAAQSDSLGQIKATVEKLTEQQRELISEMHRMGSAQVAMQADLAELFAGVDLDAS